MACPIFLFNSETPFVWKSTQPLPNKESPQCQIVVVVVCASCDFLYDRYAWRE